MLAGSSDGAQGERSGRPQGSPGFSERPRCFGFARKRVAPPRRPCRLRFLGVPRAKVLFGWRGRRKLLIHHADVFLFGQQKQAGFPRVAGFQIKEVHLPAGFKNSLRCLRGAFAEGGGGIKGDRHHPDLSLFSLVRQAKKAVQVRSVIRMKLIPIQAQLLAKQTLFLKPQEPLEKGVRGTVRAFCPFYLPKPACI